MTAPAGMLQNNQISPGCYSLYGITVLSTMQLDCLRETPPGCASTELYDAPASIFRTAVPDTPLPSLPERWFRHVTLPDGTDYLRWSKLFEFLISPDGRRIACHALNDVSAETFQAYLVSQTLSFALIKQGIEPLHATVVVIGKQAVAFLGDCAYGKSSLGAAFVQAGHRLLTDDVLVTSHDAGQRHRTFAHPGPARIKLFPGIAAHLLGRHRPGVSMNPATRKLILPLTSSEHCTTAVPLAAIYVLRAPTSHPAPSKVVIRTLSPRQACLKLIANTFNTIITKPARLARQLAWAARMAGVVPVKSLSYPRRLTHISAVLTAIQKDLAQ